MAYNFAYLPQKENLTGQEQQQLKNIFPNADTAKMQKLGYESLEFSYSSGAPLHPLCNQNYCDIKNKTIAEYIDQNTGLKVLQELPPAYLSFCKFAAVSCTTIQYLSLNYNCLGWALGIREWIDTRKIGNQEVHNNPQELNSYLDELKIQYPTGHPKNVLNILQDIEIKADGCVQQGITKNTKLPINDNAVLFYFTNELTHGARFAHEVNNATIDDFTSKLGKAFLISHGIEDLSDNNANASYGIPMCYSINSDTPNYMNYYIAGGVAAILITSALVYNHYNHLHDHVE